MDKVKASLLSPCLGPVTFMEEKQGFGFVFASQSRFGVGQNDGNPSSSSSFQRVEHCNFLRGVRSFGTYIFLILNIHNTFLLLFSNHMKIRLKIRAQFEFTVIVIRLGRIMATASSTNTTELEFLQDEE